MLFKIKLYKKISQMKKLYVVGILSFIFLFFPNFSMAFTYGSNILIGTPSCNSTAGSVSCSNGNDGNTATRWFTNGASPGYWILDTGGSYTVSKISFWADNDNETAHYLFEGSDDGATWVTLVDDTVPHGGGGVNQYDTEFVNTTPYQYYQVTVDSNYRGDNFMGFYEIEAYECLDCGGGGGGDIGGRGSTGGTTTSAPLVLMFLQVQLNKHSKIYFLLLLFFVLVYTGVYI